MKMFYLDAARKQLFFIYPLVFLSLLLSLQPRGINVSENVFVFLKLDEVIVSWLAHLYF
jgi:hypothetical protein